jgi:hypothetical protein
MFTVPLVFQKSTRIRVNVAHRLSLCIALALLFSAIADKFASSAVVAFCIGEGIDPSVIRVDSRIARLV